LENLIQKTISYAFKILSRYQVTLPKNSSIALRIKSLNQKFTEMNLTEIVKLALIKLDNETIVNSTITTRLPDQNETEAIEQFLKKPQLLGTHESEKYINSLKNSI
jgi:hypothetical protein